MVNLDEILSYLRIAPPFCLIHDIDDSEMI